MNESLVKQVFELWGTELGYSLNSDVRNGFERWLKAEISDGEFNLIASGIRMAGSDYATTGKRPAPKRIMSYVSEQRAKSNIGPNDNETTKVECSLCGMSGIMWVLFAYSEQHKRRKPYPKVRDARANREVYCLPQPCYCSNGDKINNIPQFCYTQEKRRKMAEHLGMKFNAAYRKQLDMIRLHDQATHQPTYGG